jgi:cytochrome c553
MQRNGSALTTTRRPPLRPFLLLLGWVACAPASAATPGDATPSFKQLDSIDARVQGCVTCHGHSGEGTASGYFPRIAGKPSGYLYNQLAAFRDGTRKYPPMNYLVATLPDAYLREIADHFAQERPPFGTPQGPASDASVLLRGKTLATVGDAVTGVPACVACHGAGLTGMQPAIPGLVGLRSNYVVAQLTSWRVGNRHAIAPDCMKRIATRLTDADVGAVAAWLSQQAPPKNPEPGSADLERMPLACGSQGQVER